MRFPGPHAALTEREEKTSIAIEGNEVFSGCTKTFTGLRLCAAIVDRLTFHGTIIESGPNSYRLNHTESRRSSCELPTVASGLVELRTFRASLP